MKKIFKILGSLFAAVLLFAGLLYIGSERTAAADDVTVVTVTDYGANGSDTKSDRTAIQNCLNMAKDGKAVKVVIPAGKYYIDDVLIAYDNTTISLAANAEIIRMDDTKLMLANYRDKVTGGYGQGSNIVIEGGKWNGNVKNTTNLSPLMLFYHAQNITVRNTDVGSYCARHAIIFGGVKKGTVDNVKIHDFVAYTGTDPDGEYYTSDDEFQSLSSMEALHLDCIAKDGESEAGALPLDGTPCAEITVSNCEFTNVPVGLGNHYEGYTATGLTVSKNKFNNVKYLCIEAYSYKNININGNTAQNVSAFAKFIDSAGTVSDNNITCKATSDKLYGIYVYTNSNVAVDSNTITNSNLDAIALYNAKSSSISNNKIYSPKDNGIAVYGTKSVVTRISNNTVQNGKNGIVLSYASAGTIHYNTITKPSEHGISLVNNAKAEISLNEITSPTKNGVSVNKSTATVISNNIKNPVLVGVGLYSASNSEVSTNSIADSGSHGIEVSNSTSCKINGNIIKLPKAQGIGIYSSKTITADSNTVVTAAKNGMFIDASSVTVRSNKISDAKEHGIMVQNNSTGTISSNTLTSPVKNGVSVNNAAVTVSSNKISDAGNVGIMVYSSKQSASKTVSDNQISNAGSHGIEVNDSAACKINGNTVRYPGGHGIRTYASKTVTVSSNTVDTAARNGVYIDSSTVTAQNNNISGAKEHGIIVQNGSTGTVSGNKITSPVKNGVSVNNAAVTVSSNTISNTGDMGIMIYNSKQTTSKTVNSNTITGSKGIGIQVNGSSNVTVRGNSVNNGRKHGIQAYQSSNVKITNNVVKSSTNHGITANYSTNTTVTYNIVTGSGSRDLCANDNSTGSASNNAITKSDMTWTYNASKFPMSKNGHEYWINYNANGGSGSMATTTVMYGVSTPTTANTFTRSGYTFTGWTAYRASDKKWYCGNDGWRTAAEMSSKGYKKHVYPNKSAVAKTTSVNGDTVTFYAEWKKNSTAPKYTIKFNANGGSGSMANQTITYGVSTVTRANTFTRSGYTFTGWTAYRASDKKWYCGNDGWRTAAEMSSKGYKKHVYPNKSAVSKTTAVNGDTVTFYAEWKKNSTTPKYTIKFNANGGSGSMADQTITYGVSTVTRANTFTRSGYTFTGWTAYRASDKKWFCGNDGWRTAAEMSSKGYKKHVYPNKSAVSKTTAVNGDTVTFYAEWKKSSTTPKYTIKFNANGGSGSMANQTITYGVSTVTRANTFTRSGYTFTGWTAYRASDKKWFCGNDGWRTAAEMSSKGYKKHVYPNKSAVSKTTAVNGDTVTFYAEWKKGAPTYTIKYNANGGSGSMANQTITYGVSTVTRANTFTRSGYTFTGWTAYRASDKKWFCGNDGWRTAAEMSSKGYKKHVYPNKSAVSKTTAVNGDTVTFYAEWKK